MTEQVQPNVVGSITVNDISILIDMAQRAATPAERQWLQLKFGGQPQPIEEESEEDNGAAG